MAKIAHQGQTCTGCLRKGNTQTLRIVWQVNQRPFEPALCAFDVLRMKGADRYILATAFTASMTTPQGVPFEVKVQIKYGFAVLNQSQMIAVIDADAGSGLCFAYAGALK